MVFKQNPPNHKLNGSQFGNNSHAKYVFISLYGINTNVIHLLVLFEQWYRAHCLNTNVICLFVSFTHRCCMSICVVYTRKSYTRLSCLNNAQDSCLTNTNLWNNKFWMDSEQTHEAYKFVMTWLEVASKSNVFWCLWKSIAPYFHNVG
jgi:hypothetical protein